MLQPISSDHQMWEVVPSTLERTPVRDYYWLTLRPRRQLQSGKRRPVRYWDAWRKRRLYARLHTKRLALPDDAAVYRARDIYNLLDLGGLTYGAALKGIKQIPPLFAREFAEFRVDRSDDARPSSVLTLVVSLVDQIHKLAPKRALVLDSRSQWPESLISSPNARVRIPA